MSKKEVNVNILISILLVLFIAIATSILINYKHTKIDTSQNIIKSQKDLLLNADSWYKNHEYVKAIQQYKRIIEKDPEFYPAYIGLGQSYIQLGIYDEAIKTFEKTFQIKYYDFRTYYGLGLSYYMIEDYKKAYDYYKLAYDLNPNDKRVIANFIDANNALGLYDEAIKIAQDKLITEKYNHYYYRTIAVSYLLKGDITNALESIQQAIQLNSSYDADHIVLGNVYLYSRQVEDAIKEFSAALNIRISGSAYQGLSAAYALLGNTRLSKENDKLAAAYPISSFSSSLMGFIFFQNKEYNKSIEQFETAIQSNVNYYLPYKGLGEVYIELGQRDKAIENFENAIALNEFDDESKNMLTKLKINES